MADLQGLRQAVAQSPDNVPLLLLFAQACLDDWGLDEARESFERALAHEPANRVAKLGVARVHFLEGRTSEAAVRVERLVQDDPGFAEGHLFLSRLHLAEGNREQAVAAYRQARKVDATVRDESLAADLNLRGPNDGEKQRRAVSTHAGWEAEDADEGEEEEDDGDGASIIPDLIAELERPGMSFEDVGGMEELKEQIRMKILYPIENAELFEAYGKRVGGGVLLYGPPGCGKTLISRATAGEIQANFFAVGLHDVLDMYVGSSEKNLHQIFQMARDNAPSVLFFDEVDALAADRRDMRQSAGRTVINQFLNELDGGDDANEGVLVLGATNAPWHIDPAFRRPGRFDRTVFVPPPDVVARQAIIELMALEKPMGTLDAAALAKKTKNFSGADLKSLFDLATEVALTEAMKLGRLVPLDTKALARAAKDVKPSTRAWFDSAKNYALYANQGGFYDEVLAFLGIKK